MESNIFISGELEGYEVDKDSCTVYRKMGFTHYVDIPNPDPRLPGGYKAVKEGDKAGVFHDENGKEYHEAKPLPF